MTWILILLVHVGMIGSGNSNAITNVPGFATEADCIAAGRQAKALVSGTVKALEFACVAQPKVKL